MGNGSRPRLRSPTRHGNSRTITAEAAVPAGFSPDVVLTELNGGGQRAAAVQPSWLAPTDPRSCAVRRSAFMRGAPIRNGCGCPVFSHRLRCRSSRPCRSGSANRPAHHSRRVRRSSAGPERRSLLPGRRRSAAAARRSCSSTWRTAWTDGQRRLRGRRLPPSAACCPRTNPHRFDRSDVPSQDAALLLTASGFPEQEKGMCLRRMRPATYRVGLSGAGKRVGRTSQVATAANFSRAVMHPCWVITIWNGLPRASWSS
ncbi:hypothetical protein SAMN05421541_12673 [Actinoplanes philippinensis]|uniref:Uncharacterized protein n=1 Tax=Actinoplanes philippinensis TaxID=35752 RepID=A0A1I2MAG4_9ACTN|nr:hypothetical protein SAMN05421541_12673 [Actinoplanes philippinensis]